VKSFTRVNRLLVRPTNCYQPKPKFIVTKIPDQNTRDVFHVNK